MITAGRRRASISTAVAASPDSGRWQAPAIATDPEARSAPLDGVAPAEAAALRRRWLVLAILLAAPFLAVLDGFVVTIAVPSIQDQLHATDAGVQLVVAGYVVAYAAFLIAGGRLGDIHGRRRLLVVGLALFASTSALGAMAPDQDVLILARFLQGASAALMYPQTLALIRVHFRGRDLTTATAAFGVALGLASVAAQLFGGLILQMDVMGLHWRSIFLINLPIAVVAAGLALLLVPESRAGLPSRLDLGGVALVTTGLVALVFPLIVGRELGWAPWTLWLLGGAAFIGVVFTAHERRLMRIGLAPLVSLDLFRARGFVLGLAMTLLFYGGQIPFFLLLSLYLQHGLGLDPLTTGLVFAPVAVGFFVASVGCQGVSAGRDRHLLTAGALLLSASTSALGWLALTAPDRSVILVMLPVLLACGMGYGLVIPTLLRVILRVVPTDHEGGAAGVLVTTQQVAGAVGVAVSGILFFGLLHRAGTPSYASSFATALGLDVVLFLVTALMVQGLRDARRMSEPAG